MVAFPFSTLCYKVGAPMHTPDKQTLERMMVAMTQEVDGLAG